MRQRTKQQTPESSLMSLVMDWLAANKILAFRMNSGVAKMGQRHVRFGVPGMADILAFDHYDDHVMPMWLELKSEKGNQSDMQKSFEMQVSDDGHCYFVIRSLEDLEEAFKN